MSEYSPGAPYARLYSPQSAQNEARSTAESFAGLSGVRQARGKLELTLTLLQAIEVTDQILHPCIAFSLCTLLGSGGFGGLINCSISLPHSLRTIQTTCCTLAPHMAELYAARQACFQPLFCLNGLLLNLVDSLKLYEYAQDKPAGNNTRPSWREYSFKR